MYTIPCSWISIVYNNSLRNKNCSTFIYFTKAFPEVVELTVRSDDPHAVTFSALWAVISLSSETVY